MNGLASVDADLEQIKDRLPRPNVQKQQPALQQQQQQLNNDWAKLPKREKVPRRHPRLATRGGIKLPFEPNNESLRNLASIIIEYRVKKLRISGTLG